MAQNDTSISDDTIIRLQAMQLITMRSEQPCLQDQFAMAALTGILGNTVTLEAALHSGMTHADFAGHAASASYGYADAMMEARTQKPSSDKAGTE